MRENLPDLQATFAIWNLVVRKPLQFAGLARSLREPSTKTSGLEFPHARGFAVMRQSFSSRAVRVSSRITGFPT